MRGTVQLLALLAALPAAAAETAEYTAATEAAGLIIRRDAEIPERWYVDFAGGERDWRVTVYRTPEHLLLTTLIWEEPEGVPAEVLRWALERSFDLPLFKFGLDPSGTRLHLALDLRTADTPPAAYLEALRLLAATAEREHALLRALKP